MFDVGSIKMKLEQAFLSKLDSEQISLLKISIIPVTSISTIFPYLPLLGKQACLFHI